jgi:hypothetical protein
VGFFEHRGQTYAQRAVNLYKIENGRAEQVVRYPTNGEKVRYDRGRLWVFSNDSGSALIAVLDLDTLTIKDTKDRAGNDYWDTSETWSLDRDYTFYDVIGVPHEEAVFIAVGEQWGAGPMPYVLKYSYADNAFTRVYLPDAGCEGIRAFASDGKVVYGAARQRLYVYENGAWALFCDLQIGNGFRGMKIANRHLFVISGWNSSGPGRTGGMEVVDLRARTTGYYDRTRIPIPADEIDAIEIQGFDNDTFKLWLGGPSGLAYCEFREDG